MDARHPGWLTPAGDSHLPSLSPQFPAISGGDEVVRSDARVVKVCGRPDSNESTEFEHPRPPILTRSIEYQDIDLRMIFAPEAHLGASPPYLIWKFAGAYAISTEKALSLREIEARLSMRPLVDN